MHIELASPDGYRHCITSTNFETIGRWIVETYADLSTRGWDLYKYPPRIMVYPTWNSESKQGDWVLDTRILSEGFTASTPREFLDGMSAQVRKMEVIDNAGDAAAGPL